MAYGPDDPRSQLTASPARAAEPNAAAQYLDFTSLEPDEISDQGSRSWWVRGQNFALAYTQARAGEILERTGQPDEYVVLFPQDTAVAKLTADSDESTVQGAAMVVVPAGESRVDVTADTAIVRLFSAASPDLLARCRNHADYAEPHANVAPFAPWPDPVDGPALRVYPVAEHPYEQNRFGRLFRCSTFMVNLFDPDFGPRDPAKLSPHHHDDFEQCSLAVDGQYIHHIRSPWTPDMADWREDEHVHVASPSVAIIPPPTVHTSQSVSQVRNQLIDIFCPPRHDFSAKPGWVINAAEYPAPEQP
ncbi:hypothetical protein [Prauserella flavalba]|uniref:Uncharacterized protein n=1 Tax=Prauserella flavalba TaxID=1477506 RepID=A0A318LV77_9PSEU|nr:hypothetical protein [Prauserella flavalba]PXY29512.1 hypothetical protein BA062_20140 [Prauserella flavalba]